MASIPYGFSPHRKKNPRQCDRCRERAVYNFRPESGPIQYLCNKHKVATSATLTNKENDQ